MIQLLLVVLFVEIGFVGVLLVKNPVREFAVRGVDGVRRGGRGRVVSTTVVSVMLVVLVSSVYSYVKAKKRAMIGGGLVGSDEVLWMRHLLEASLLGFSLVLWLMIIKLHNYITDIAAIKKSTEDMVKQNKMLVKEKESSMAEANSRDAELANLKVQLAVLESEAEVQLREAKTSELKTRALRKQSEDLLIEYDRLLEDNQNLRSQLQASENRKSMRSDSRKICFSRILTPLRDEICNDKPLEWQN